MKIADVQYNSVAAYLTLKRGNSTIATVKLYFGRPVALCLRCVGNRCFHTVVAQDYIDAAYAEDATHAVAVAA